MHRTNTIALFLTLTLLQIACKKDTPATKQLSVSTYAGNGQAASIDGSALAASFSVPSYLVIDKLDNVYITDFDRIRKIYPDGTVSTLPEYKPAPFFANGRFSGLAIDPNNDILSTFEPNVGDGPYFLSKFKVGGNELLLYAPNQSMLSAVACDREGKIYLGTWISGVKKYNAATKKMELFAGGEYGFADGIGVNAKIGNITDMATDANGNIYVSDYRNHAIRKITPNGVVTTLAGTNEPGFKDGKGSNARFFNPDGICIDKMGNLIVCDQGNHSIRKVTPEGEVFTIAGNGVAGYSDGSAEYAQFNSPGDVDINSLGHILVADRGNKRIRVIK